MPPDSVNILVRILHESQLLEEAQLEEVVQRLQPSFSEPRDLAKELVQRGWLTAYQIKQLAQGQARQLVLGSYVLLEPLGEGGMGQVFKARHQKMGRVVALKVIRKEQLTNPAAVRRFHREIQAAAQLSHPNVVLAFDAAQVGDTHFFAMEYVEGTDLRKLVKRHGPLPIDQACDYVHQTALGLQHAHERGLIHRDIKPSNLLLTHSSSSGKGGLIKILDLGLARWRAAETQGETASQLTQSGMVMGTPDYMAPEQAEDSHTVDIRADLYSLGCTLYYLLTARVPFPSTQMLDKLIKHKLEEATPVEQLRPEVPAALAAIVRQLMAKRPEDRYQTPGELAAALAALDVPSSITAPIPKRVDERPTPSTEPETVAYGDFEATPPALKKAGAARASGKKAGSSRGARQAARRWFWLLPIGMGVGLLAAGLAFLLWVVSRPMRVPADKQPGADPAPAEDSVTLALNELRAQIGKRDPEELRQRLLDLRLRHPGRPQAVQAADLLTQLPSALDELDPARIPPEERVAEHPKELVAVLGEHRLRHWGAVHSVALAAGGNRLASGGAEGVVRLWDPATGKELRVLHGGAGPVRSVAFSRDGKLLAAGCTGLVKLWDVATGKELASLAGHQGPVRAVAFAADGKLLASGGEDKTARLWDLTTHKELAKLPGHTVPVAALAFAPGGRMLATASQEVMLWDVATRQKRASLPHGPAVLALAFARDGNLLASGGEDKTLKLWDLTQSTERAAFKQDGPVTALAFGSSGPVLLVVSNGRARLLNPTTGREASSLAAGATAVDFAADGKTVVVGTAGGPVRVWSRLPLTERFALRGHGAAVRWVALTPDGKTLFSVGRDRVVKVWNPLTGQERATVSGPVQAAALAPDGQTLALGTGSVQLWDVATEKTRVTFETPAGAVQSVAFAPDGQTLASAHADKTVRLWEATTGKVRFTFPGAVAADTPVVFSPDSQLVAAVGEDKAVKVWFTSTGLEWASLPGHTEAVVALAFAPDGKTLASAGHDAAVRLWDLSGSQPRERSVLPVASRAVLALAFRPDGKELAAGTSSGKILCWQTATDAESQTWQLPGAVHGLAFASDGRHLATANANGTLYLLRLAPALAKGS